MMLVSNPVMILRRGGPLHTDSTEFINEELSPAGLGSVVMTDAAAVGDAGSFGGLVNKAVEAYRGPDMVTPKILDTHPSLRACKSAFTYGNQILTGGDSEFTGGSRKRAEVDLFFYGLDGNFWVPPPFGNFGRNKLTVEIAEKQGDYLGGTTGDQQARRWMPMFPEREDLGVGIELWSEELEPQHHRLINTSTALGGIGETAPTRSSPRFTHKGLIFNRAAAAIEYPFAPYYPRFVGDQFLGQEPEDRGGDLAGGTISTMWAWREQEKPIGRGTGDILAGIQFVSPPYVIDNRRLEIKMRPDEGPHTVKFTPPEYNDLGEVVKNGSLRLDDGPPQFINIDFISRNMSVVLSETPGDEESTESFYDTSKELGDAPFDAATGVKSDNLSLAAECTDIIEIDDESLDAQNLPSRFLHLAELSPGPGFSALYASDKIETPFVVDIPRTKSDQPCCQCLFYIRGIHFSLNSAFLPVNRNIDPAFDARFSNDQTFLYTWSRVPHGFPSGSAQDDGFSGIEGLADEYVSFSDGKVFTNRFAQGTISLDVQAGTAAFFPSVKFAQDNPTKVNGLDASDPKLKGGIPVGTDGLSNGQPEAITLDMSFDTYVRIQRVTIRFVAGAGFQVPKVSLTRIDQEFRVGNVVTRRTGEIIATSFRTAVGTSLDNASDFRSSDIQAGEVLYPVDIVPSFANIAFWDQFAQEYHLIFESRGGDNSMGIATIEVTLDAFVTGEEITETITINERKYYTSTGTPVDGNNPEALLTAMDSASAYWRNSSVPAIAGANRNRASAFDTKLEEDEDFNRGGDPNTLEQEQGKEYGKARDLMSHPYVWEWTSFFPLDEADQIEFFGNSPPIWTLSMNLSVKDVDKVNRHEATEDNPLLIFGEIVQRGVWNAPGHAWTWQQVEGYAQCCSPCPDVMVVDYNFAHLHDGLAVVETAQFWDELPSGFTRILRSIYAPDPTFGILTETGEDLDGGSSGGPVLMDSRLFIDSQGNPIPPSTLTNAGIHKNPDGTFVIVEGV